MPKLCVGSRLPDPLKQRERNSVSLQLEFSPKRPNPFERLVSFFEPNAYATGFFVTDRFVVTAYHVVSGKLDLTKRLALGLGRNQELEVKVYANGCQAHVVQIDEEADLALLEVCRPFEATPASFQSEIHKDEEVLLIARPQRQKVVGRGTFFGSYNLNGIEYWSLKMLARDGFSGSPVYNSRGEIIGIFSGYDWAQQVAVVSPGERAKKLLETATARSK